MGIEALLSRLQGEAVTPVTSAKSAGVTPKPAPALDCTPVTAVTPKCDVTANARACRWLLHFADAEALEVTFAPERDQAEVLAWYSDAIAAEPLPETTAMVPAELLALFDACARAGLCDDADRAALPAMFALDPEGTRKLIEAMHDRIASCRRCAHFRRPGRSDGYCSGRDNLPIVYAFLRALPDDEGMRCEVFERIANACAPRYAPTTRTIGGAWYGDDDLQGMRRRDQ
jgi:hypothetical protein